MREVRRRLGGCAVQRFILILSCNAAKSVSRAHKDFVKYIRNVYASSRLSGGTAASLNYTIMTLAATFEVLPAREPYLKNRSLFMMLDLSFEILELKAKNAQLAKELEQSRQAYSELSHRIKNELQVFSALFATQLRTAGQPEHCALCLSRISAAAALHHALEDDRAGKLYLGTFLSSLAAILDTAFDGNVAMKIAVETDIPIDHYRAQKVGIIYTEAVINAFKHGFPHGATGTIETRLNCIGDELELIIANDGEALNSGASNGKGVGLMQTLAAQLAGELNLKSLAKGVEVRLAFPRQTPAAAS